VSIAPCVLLHRAADLLKLVRVNQRANALVREHLGQQALIHAAVDEMHARHARPARGGGELRLGKHLRREVGLAFGQQLLQLAREHLPQHPALAEQAVRGGDVNELHRLERLGHGDRHMVGVHAIRAALAIETQRRHHGNDTRVHQLLEQLHVHPLDLAGEQMVHAADDALGVRDDGVGAGRAQVVGRQPFENLVRQPVRGGQRELERLGVGHAGAVGVRRLGTAFVRQRLDLRARAMHQRHADVQRAQHGDIQQDVREVVVGDDRAINGDDEGLLPEARDVAEDAPQVGGFHVGRVGSTRVRRATRWPRFAHMADMKQRAHPQRNEKFNPRPPERAFRWR
jgi:hypothetical protein